MDRYEAPGPERRSRDINLIKSNQFSAIRLITANEIHRVCYAFDNYKIISAGNIFSTKLA